MMQTKRAMILVSNDPESIRLGANELIQHLSEALIAYDLQDEVEISTLPNVGTTNILPLVVVYPEATVSCRAAEAIERQHRLAAGS
jgi:hypothetical protein